MTTLSTVPAASWTGIPFTRLARVELRKLTDTRASRWLLLAIAAVTPVVLAVMLVVASPANLTYSKLIDYSLTPQELVLPALGILTITGEWSQRTALTTFTLVPSRRRVLLAKGTATLSLGLAVIAIAFAAAALANLLGGLRHGNGSWTLGPSGFGELILVQMSGLLQGLAFGLLLRVTAAALAAYYVLPTLWSLLFTATAGLKQVDPWIDLIKAQSPLYTHQITGTGWLRILTAASIWILLPLAAGIIRTRRKEIS